MPIDIGSLLAARSVAIIGASSDPHKIGGRPVDYLKRLGYPGRIVPVNPAYDQVQGLPCARSIGEAGAVDLAIVSTPAAGAADAVLDSIAAGVRGIILFTAGYAEAGEAGRAAQRRLSDAAAEAGAVLLGPNCLGTLNVHARLAATFTTALETLDPTPGGLSYVGQSGALGAYWIGMTAAAGLGIAKWITTGNEAQVTSADAIAYLAADRETRVICAYIEDIKAPDAFAESVKAAQAAGKQVLAIKSGQSAAGARAAAAHTAAQAGDAEAYAALLRDCGVIRVGSLSEMIDTGRLIMAARPPVRGRRLGVVTVSGGAGVLICDAASANGLDIVQPPPATREELAGFLPGFARPQNPVDVTGAVVSDRQLMERTLLTLAAAGCYDSILVFLGSMGSIADGLIAALGKASGAGVPLVVVWMAAPPGARDRVEALGIPVFDEIPPAIVALARVNIIE